MIGKIRSGCMQEINHLLLNEMKFSITLRSCLYKSIATTQHRLLPGCLLCCFQMPHSMCMVAIRNMKYFENFISAVRWMEYDIYIPMDNIDENMRGNLLNSKVRKYHGRSRRRRRSGCGEMTWVRCDGGKRAENRVRWHTSNLTYGPFLDARKERENLIFKCVFPLLMKTWDLFPIHFIEFLGKTTRGLCRVMTSYSTPAAHTSPVECALLLR